VLLFLLLSAGGRLELSGLSLTSAATPAALLFLLALA